jgi:hypothetical protein
MDAIWGQRRFFVPGVVFLAVLAIAAALSGSFAGFHMEEGQAGLAAIAAVVAGGVAGYPLGLILYIPFAFLFRAIGGYGHFVHFKEFCASFLTATESSADSLGAVRALCQEGLGDAKRAEKFYESFYERFVPERVDRPARGRWETFHTSGGMISAIIFGSSLSPLFVAVTDHETPWWDDRGILASMVSIAIVVIGLLGWHALILAREAAATEKQWADRWLDVIRRRPDILEAAALDKEFDRWALREKQNGGGRRRRL